MVLLVVKYLLQFSITSYNIRPEKGGRTTKLR